MHCRTEDSQFFSSKPGDLFSDVVWFCSTFRMYPICLYTTSCLCGFSAENLVSCETRFIHVSVNFSHTRYIWATLHKAAQIIISQLDCIQKSVREKKLCAILYKLFIDFCIKSIKSYSSSNCILSNLKLISFYSGVDLFFILYCIIPPNHTCKHTQFHD